MSLAISVHELDKKFRVYRRRPQSLKRAIVSRQRAEYSEFYALRSISLEIAPGEIYGLIGSNGSGKSTLLRVIAGIYPPTSGRVSIDGTVTALLELGAGFDPELTGYENILFNGAIYGMSRKKMRAMADDVIEFSGLDDFIHTPIKFYSQGMYARLGFSLAIRIPTDILLVDEVLSVGDEEFQRKSADAIGEIVGNGRTVLFVSHALDVVERLCDRVSWLSHGSVVQEGPAGDVVANYLEAVDAQELPRG